jgi:nicotinamidase-related amidase
VVPHHRPEPNDYAGWFYPTLYQLAAAAQQTFARGSWGGEWHPDFVPQASDIVVKEHWGASGFANTDLDQQLEQHGVQRVIVVGLIANTCVEGTSRLAMEGATRSHW